MAARKKPGAGKKTARKRAARKKAAKGSARKKPTRATKKAPARKKKVTRKKKATPQRKAGAAKRKTANKTVAAKKKPVRKKKGARKKKPATGRKKPPARKRTAAKKKPTTRKKVTARKKPATRKKPPARRAVSRAPVSTERTASRIPRDPAAEAAHASAVSVGVVRHYFPRAAAAVIEVAEGNLRVGDTVHIRGHTTDYYQRIDRIEVEHRPVAVANAGESVGVHVSQRVREGDRVSRVD
jgi:hypothetical protein